MMEGESTCPATFPMSSYSTLMLAASFAARERHGTGRSSPSSLAGPRPRDTAAFPLKRHVFGDVSQVCFKLQQRLKLSIGIPPPNGFLEKAG